MTLQFPKNEKETQTLADRTKLALQRLSNVLLNSYSSQKDVQGQRAKKRPLMKDVRLIGAVSK